MLLKQVENYHYEQWLKNLNCRLFLFKKGVYGSQLSSVSQAMLSKLRTIKTWLI